MKISSDITFIDRYKCIKQKSQNIDAYEAFAINELINAKNKCSFMNIVKDLVEKGLSFQLTDFKVLPFKLPSKGPYQAIHFLWKENSADDQISNNPQRLKLVTEVKEKAQTFYSRSTQKEVKGKLPKLGIEKPINHDAHYANAVYKFLKQRAIKNRNNVAFFSTSAKCKVSVGEPGFLVAAVVRGKKVVVSRVIWIF